MLTSTATVAAIAAAACCYSGGTAEKEKEGAFMADCRLLFSIIISCLVCCYCNHCVYVCGLCCFPSFWQ